MDSDHEDDVEEGELVVGIDVSRDRRRLHHEALDEKEDTLVAIQKQEELLKGQPEDPQDPDYDADKIAELDGNIQKLGEHVKWLVEQAELAEAAAVLIIQCAARTRSARRRFHRLLQNTFEKVYDFKAEAYFYYNKRTGATSWKPPACMKDDFFSTDIENVGTFGKPSGFDEADAGDLDELNRLARLKKKELGVPRSNRVEDWTVQQVVEWFEECTLEQFQYGWKESVMEELAVHEINGAVLVSLDTDDYKELGIKSGLHVKRLQVKLKHCKMRWEREMERQRKEEEGEYIDSDESDIEYSSTDDESLSDDEQSESGDSEDEESDEDESDEDESDAELTPQELEELRQDEENIAIEVLFPGDNERFPLKGDVICCHYTSFLADGTEFDSSRHRGHHFEFVLGAGQVIKGWDRAVMKMSFGERAMLSVSPKYAYGSQGLPPIIKPHSALRFDIELISWRTPPMWTKPLIMAEEDIMTSDKDLYFWDPESLVEEEPDFQVIDQDD